MEWHRCNWARDEGVGKGIYEEICLDISVHNICNFLTELMLYLPMCHAVLCNTFNIIIAFIKDCSSKALKLKLYLKVDKRGNKLRFFMFISNKL